MTSLEAWGALAVRGGPARRSRCGRFQGYDPGSPSDLFGRLRNLRHLRFGRRRKWPRSRKGC